jgi:predicted nucleic acid-binding protein
VTFLDAYALVAFIGGEPAAPEVRELLRARDTHVIVVNLAEALDALQRVHGVGADEVREVLDPLLLDRTLSIAVSEESDAWLTASLRARHYDRKSCAVSVPDCFLLAHALAGDGRIATADPAVVAAARVEGVRVVPLPDSTGARPGD